MSFIHVRRCSPHLRSLRHLTLPRQFCQAQGHHVMINTNITTTDTHRHNHSHEHQNCLRSITAISKLNHDEKSFNTRKKNHFNQYQYSKARPQYRGPWLPSLHRLKIQNFFLTDTYLHVLTGAYFRAANQCWRETKVMFETNKYIWKPLCPNLMLLLCFCWHLKIAPCFAYIWCHVTLLQRRHWMLVACFCEAVFGCMLVICSIW